MEPAAQRGPRQKGATGWAEPTRQGAVGERAALSQIGALAKEKWGEVWASLETSFITVGILGQPPPLSILSFSLVGAICPCPFCLCSKDPSQGVA